MKKQIPKTHALTPDPSNPNRLDPSDKKRMARSLDEFGDLSGVILNRRTGLLAGGSVYWLTDTVDGGPIARQGWCFVRPGDTASELWRRDLFPMGVRLLRETLAEISAGVLTMVDQDDALATWEPSFTGAPRLRRPELKMIGPGPEGFSVAK